MHEITILGLVQYIQTDQQPTPEFVICLPWCQTALLKPPCIIYLEVQTKHIQVNTRQVVYSRINADQ